MSKINAKQVSGVLDQDSQQEVSGSKEFSAPQHFPGDGICMTLFGGAIYWCQNQGVLETPGNVRLRVQEGSLITESFDGESWSSR